MTSRNLRHGFEIPDDLSVLLELPPPKDVHITTLCGSQVVFSWRRHHAHNCIGVRICPSSGFRPFLSLRLRG